MKERIIIAGVLVAVAAASAAWAISIQIRSGPVDQPIACSHKRHLEKGITCQACHEREDLEETASGPVKKGE